MNNENVENQEPTQEELSKTQEDYQAEYDALWDKYLGEDKDGGSKIEEPTDEQPIDDEPTKQEIQEDADGGSNNEEPTQEQQKIDNSKIDEDKELSEEQKEEIKKWKLKAIGTEFELTDDELIEFAKKGIDYTQKTQELSKWRNKIELTQDIPDEILNAVKDLQNGNKDALVKLAKEYNVDLYDLDTEVEPKIKDYSTNPIEAELREVEERILQDKEVLPDVESTLAIVPEEFKQQMAQNPKLLHGLYVDIKNGVGKKAVAEALKNQVLYGGDFLTNYGKAYQSLVQEPKSVQPAKETVQEAKKATIPSTKQATKKKDYLADAQEIWNMPSEDFAKYKARVMKKINM